ncbi:MAG TPA: hypothetical protein DCS87_03465 [Rheinheimera sp.]|nr:hypothetical protein [Rheinheimera sp.]
MFCTQCGGANEDSAKFCASCGAELQGKNTATHQISMDDYYKAIVGPKSQDYYLQRFSRFDQRGSAGASWNWPAFFVTFYWFLYRKMWLHALVYFFLPTMMMVPASFAAAMAGSSANIVSAFCFIAYLVGIFVLLPMYANSFYYNHCQKKIAHEKASSNDVQRQLSELTRKGGTSGIALIFVVLLAVFGVGILAAVALPAYQSYTMKARVFEAVKVGSQAADSVASYYNQHQEIPANLQQAGFTTALPAFVQDITINRDNGVVTITLSAPQLDGKTILLVPSVDSNKQIVWGCMSQTIEKMYLPQHCQQ